MKRIKTWIAAHTVLAAIIGSLVIAGGAAAAWNVMSGVDPASTAEANVSTQTTSPVIKLNAAWCASDGGSGGVTGGTVDPNTAGDVCAIAVNSATVAETITSLPSPTITADAGHSACTGSSFTFHPSAAVIGPVGTGKAWPVGTSAATFIGTLTAAANTPSACSGAQLTLAFNGGTTSP